MAEEDLIFGKNRHFFGGIEPSNMLEFTATSFYNAETDTPGIKISYSLPKNTIIDGQQLCSVAGVIIRRKENDYPKNEFDGDFIIDATSDGEVIDDDVILDTHYYYSAFPYTSQGVYNRSNNNRSDAISKKFTYLFGYDINLNNQNANERVSYPNDVMNKDFNSAFMNFDSDTFEYGSWPSEAGIDFMPKPCMLGFDGIVKEWLDPNDYTKQTNGEPSHISDQNFEANAMMEWPKIYTHREEVNNTYKFRCSDIKVGLDWDCLCNYDKNNNEIDHFYTPIYFGSDIGGKLRSISGKSNFVNNTAQVEVNKAKANGEGWYTEVVADRFLIQDLLVLMAKSTNTQEKFGHGNNSTSSAISQGLGNSKGLFWGASNDSSLVKVFGMENWWGNLWRRTAGWINANGTQKIKITRGTHDGSTSEDYNFDGAGYLIVSDAIPIGTSGGYINKTKNMKYGRIPYSANGSATTNETDGLWFNNGQNNFAFCGGSWVDSSAVGAFCVNLGRAASDSRSDYGAALSYKKLIV